MSKPNDQMPLADAAARFRALADYVANALDTAIESTLATCPAEHREAVGEIMRREAQASKRKIHGYTEKAIAKLERIAT